MAGGTTVVVSNVRAARAVEAAHVERPRSQRRTMQAEMVHLSGQLSNLHHKLRLLFDAM